MNSKAELKGRVALIPGAGRPIGRAIADQFGGRGASLVLPLFDDWPGANQQMKEQFHQAGYDFICVDCDLRSRDQTQALIEEIRHCYGALHYLINNIERGGMPVVHGSYDLEVNKDQWQLEIDTTLKAKWNLYQSCGELLSEADEAALINVSSIAALTGRSGPASPLFSDGYSASNRAIAGFTSQWARELAPTVRVNEVMLGLIDTRHGEGTRGWAQLDENQRRELLGRTLAGRTGSPEEVAEFIYFLAVRARYLNGAVIPFDGGYLCGREPGAKIPPGILRSEPPVPPPSAKKIAKRKL